MSANENEAIKKQALKDFANHVNPQKARILKNSGLDIIEDKREGAAVWDITGKKYIDCITSAGSFNVGRRNPEVVNALKDALDPATEEYLKGLRELCDANDILLIFDEIQTGFGRTGKMFCCEHSGVVPDIMTVAKSLGGAIYPISATIYREELNDFVMTHPFTHLSTFGGSDLGCVVGLSVIDYLVKNNVPEHAEKMGNLFQEGFDTLLEKYPELLLEVRRKGLMMGLQYTNDSIGPRMSYQLAQHGVIALYTGNETSVMRLMPVLEIQTDQVAFVLDALDKAMAEIMKQGGIEEY